jgi:glycosyltransferase involved in cell wall biosynthesis
VKIALWTTWQAANEVAHYSRQLAEALDSRVDLSIVPVPYADRLPSSMAQILAPLNEADLVHIQHDYRFWGGIEPRASTLPDYLRHLRRPWVMTAHNTGTVAELLRVEDEERGRQRLAKALLSKLPTFRNRVEREPFAGAAALIVHTHAAHEQLASRGLPADRLHVIPPGVPQVEPEDPQDVAVQAVRRRFGLGDARVVTLFGFSAPSRGYDLALHTLSRMPPGIKLLIAGPAEESVPWFQGKLEREIDGRGWQSWAILTGDLEQKDIPRIMALSDLVLVPYTEEVEWYSVLTALAHGRPVLAADLAPFREIAAEGHCLELFPAGDERALADRIGFILASAGTRARLGTAARAWAAARTWEAVAERTVAVYNTVLHREGQRS